MGHFNVKVLYISLVNNKYEKPYIQNFWNKFFNVKVSWTNIWKFSMNKCMENKLKQFHFKLIHHLVPCNFLLHKWKLAADPLCCHCQLKDDYEHFFVSCNKLVQLRSKL